MIKFFRHIRKKLLTENKIGDYLIYALGEIILVVIGILIALQVNNWNLQNKINKEEQIYLSALIENVDQDISELQWLIRNDSLSLIANKILLSAFENDSIRRDKSALQFNFIQTSFINSFSPNQPVFNQLTSTAKLNYISNDSIKNQIQEYYDGVEFLVRMDSKNDNVLIDLGISIMKYSDGNSMLQSTIPEFARLELDDFDNSIFYKNLESEEVKDFASLISLRQTLLTIKDFQYRRVLKEGNSLRNNISEYLAHK